MPRHLGPPLITPFRGCDRRAERRGSASVLRLVCEPGVWALPAFDAGAMEQAVLAVRGEPKDEKRQTAPRPSGIINPSMGDVGVTVFGGTGFLGRGIVARLAAAGTRVRVAVRHTTEGIPPQGGDIEVVYADVRDGGTVAQAVRDSDAVVNAVGLYVERGEATFQAVHIDGAQEVARAAREAGIGCLVHISGIGADVNSESSYVRSRAVGERAVREACPGAIILRPSVLFGRGDALFRYVAAITRISPVFPFSVTDRHGCSRCLWVMSRRRP